MYFLLLFYGLDLEARELPVDRKANIFISPNVSNKLGLRLIDSECVLQNICESFNAVVNFEEIFEGNK